MLPIVARLMRRSSEQGFTLVEAIVAIVAITVVIAAIAPPILISMATRLQNQRVEQATELAKGEIDRIRLLVERGQYQPLDLPPPHNPQTTLVQNTPPLATGTAGYTLNRADITATRGLAIDVNGGGSDFVIQAFRVQQQLLPPNNIPIAFWMGVRVYSFRSFTSNLALETPPISLPLGLTSGENLRRPLAVFYTPVVRADRDFSLCAYWRLALNNPTAPSCPPN